MTQPRPLSKRQVKILDFIIEQIQTRGYGPTVREIVNHVGDKSPTSVHRHMKTLEARGHISREANKSRSIRLTEEHRGLPLAGVIAAGSPIEAVENVQRYDLSNIYDPQNHFMLKVRGDSMIEDHIDDGDLIVVRKQSTCRDGETVVALIDGENATLKRFYREAGKVRLQPANQSLEPIYVESSRVSIDGVMVGVVRQVAASPAC
ncbi:MAG: transcriptional repressor LexA [Planctomycetota bacterium]|nr:transcriptional repressor LexA [Planctomycetota bacterium]